MFFLVVVVVVVGLVVAVVVAINVGLRNLASKFGKNQVSNS